MVSSICFFSLCFMCRRFCNHNHFVNCGIVCLLSFNGTLNLQQSYVASFVGIHSTPACKTKNCDCNSTYSFGLLRFIEDGRTAVCFWSSSLQVLQVVILNSRFGVLAVFGASDMGESATWITHILKVKS